MNKYQEILKSVGYPTEVLLIDFETYYDTEYSLSKMSTIEYICDPQFEFTGMGYFSSNVVTPEALFCNKDYLPEFIKDLQDVFGQNLEQVTVVAKNCKFDITILAVKFGIIPPFIIDIDDLLRHYDARMSHRMKDVTSMFGLKPKGKTVKFKGLHYEDMDDETKAALAEYCINDVEIESSLFSILLPLITNPAVEIPVARHTLDLYLRPRFRFDFDKAKKLKATMTLTLMEIAQRTGYDKKWLSSNLDFVKILQEALPEGEHVPTKPGKPGRNMTKLLGKPRVIPAFAKDDVGFQELLVHSDEVVRNLCTARQAVKSWPLHIKRITNMMAQAVTHPEGLLRILLNYYAAHTGRWGGGGGINPQNLGGRGRAGAGTHPLIQAMRSLLCCPDGSILGIADSAQIEARILAWFANQEDLVRGFADGEDIYSVFATRLFNSAVWKPKETDSAPIKHLLKIRRAFGKDAILGCGYGMGTNKFYQRCIANADLRPLFDSGDYDWDFINNLISTYRTTYNKIPEFWTAVEKAFKWVIKYPHEQTQVSRKYDENGTAAGFRLAFFNKKGTVHIILPSGRHLTYRHCAIKKTTKGSEIRWHWGHLWGGSITENIVQAVARDLLAFWILEVDKANLPVVLHSHDEIVCMLQKNDVHGLEDMLKIMCAGPEWADGLPLDAEGSLANAYKK